MAVVVLVGLVEVVADIIAVVVLRSLTLTPN